MGNPYEPSIMTFNYFNIELHFLYYMEALVKINISRKYYITFPMICITSLVNGLNVDVHDLSIVYSNAMQ